ncbi:MAG TPA: carboxypeptidase regulatory-like domain-containing protein [Gemmatimonadaceae bacterium]|nr:carboxypeptidase regulatory-like domain-containing protein [Gemmatimonadaceae bacterium]
MRLRLILSTAIALAATRAGAQDLKIEVVEAATGKPIIGANVSLFDSAGTIPLLGGFSDQSGRIDLRAPMRGPYRVRADKVGYDSWLSVQLAIGDRTVFVRAGMIPGRNTSPVFARNESACQQMVGPGSAIGDLWTEIRKALTASAMTESQGLVPLDVDVYERILDKDGAVISERTEQRNRIARRPVLGISWDQIDTTRRNDASGIDVFRAPDAATITADQFVKSHCFAAIRGYGAETGLTGLEFKPARVGGPPELTGVLWLDPKTNSLRALNFDYVNLPIPLRIARTSGRLEFDQLPNGQWIVPRWYIRMPRLAHVTSRDSRSAAVAADTLIGYQEVGGVARPAGSARPAATAGSSARLTSGSLESAGQTTISGFVFDSSNSRGLANVQVSTAGGRYKTMTNASGRYELAIDGALNDTIVFDHPRLRLLHVPGRMQTISLPSGARGQASLFVPSYETLRKTICGRNATATEAQGMMAGYVSDAAGRPIARAHVWAAWPLQWIEQNGRLVAANRQMTVETDSNSDGSYLMCGFTRGAQITVKVGVAGHRTVEERLVLPNSLVLEHDFQISSR